MNKAYVAVLIFYAPMYYAAESREVDLQPYSIYKQAADKLLTQVPQHIKIGQRFSSEVLAHQLKLIVPKRVENHTLIENILYRDSPLQSEETVLLLLQINNAVSTEHEQALQKQQKKHYIWSGLTFAAFISTLAVVLSS